MSGRTGIRPIGLAVRLRPHTCSVALSSPSYGHGFPALALPSVVGYFLLAGFLAAGLPMDHLCPELLWRADTHFRSRVCCPVLLPLRKVGKGHKAEGALSTPRCAARPGLLRWALSRDTWVPSSCCDQCSWVCTETDPLQPHSFVNNGGVFMSSLSSQTTTHLL